MGEQSAVLGLGSKIEAGTKQAFSTIADGFRQIAKAMSDSAASMRKVGQDAPAKIFEEAAKGVNKLTSSLDKQVASTKMLSKAQVEGKAVVDAHAEAQAKSASKIAKANAELEKSSLISAKASAQLEILKAKYHDVLNGPGAKGKSANNLLSSFLSPGLGAGGEITLPKINDGGQTKVLEAQLQRLQRSFRETEAVAKKSASSFQALNAKFPGFEKQIRSLDKTNLSYNEQINVLKRLKAARAEVEASQLKENKAQIAAASLNAKAAASVEALAIKYNKLLAVGGSIGASARNIFKNYTPLASDHNKLVEMKVRLSELQKKLGEVAATATKSASSFQALNAKFPGFEKQIRALDKTNLSYDEQINVLSRLKAVRAQAEASQLKENKALVQASNLSAKASASVELLAVKYSKLLATGGAIGVSARNIFKNYTPLASDGQKLAEMKLRLSDLQKKLGEVTTSATKSAASFQKLNSAFPGFEKQIRALDKTNLSYDEQVNVLKRLKQVRQDVDRKYSGFEAEAAALKKTSLSYSQQIAALEKLKAARVQAEAAQLNESKAQIAAANLNTKTAASVEALAIKYQKLLAVGGSIGASARNIFKNYTPLASDGQKLVEMKVRLSELQKKLGEVSAAATKSASSFQSLNAKFPGFEKQIRALDKTNLSYDEQVNVLKRLKQARQDVDRKYSGFEAEAAALKKTSLSYSQQIAALEKLKAARKDAGVSADKEAVNYSKQSEGIQKLRKQYADLRLSTDRYGVAANKIIGNIQRHNIEIDKASAALARLKQQQKIAEGGFTTIGGAINTTIKKLQSYAGYMVASSAVFAFIASIRSAVTTIADYDQSLRDLQAITNPTQKELAEMGATLKKVAGDTKFSASEVAEGMKLLGQAGLEAHEVIEAMPGVTNLATGTMSDLSSVIDLTSTTMRAFGIAAKDTGYITDVFANAVNKSKLTIEDIKTAFNYIAPAAHNAGMSLDETARVMMVLRDNGLKASSMATGFRRILAKLAIPTESLKKGIAEAGMSMADFDVNALGISKVLHNLAKVVKTNQDAFEDFGVYGSAAVTALIKDVDKFDALAGTINKQGSAAEMAAIQMQGLQNMFKNLQTKVQGLWIALGEGGLTGVLKAMVNVARTAVDVITDLANNGFVQFIAKALIARGAVAVFVTTLQWFGKTSVVTAALAAMSAGIGAVAAPATAATSAVTVLTGSIGALKAMVVSFAPTAIIAALGYMVYKTLTYKQTLKDTAVELGVLTEKAESSAASLEQTAKKIQEGTLSQEDQKTAIDGLVDKYKDFGVELRNAAGDSEKLVEVLNKIKEVEALKSKNALTASLRNTALQLEENVKSQESWLTALRHGVQSEDVAKESKQEFISANNKLVESMVKSAKEVGKTNEEIRTGFNEMAAAGMLGGQTDAVLSRMEETLKSLEDPAYQAGLKSGKAVSDGMAEGFDESDIQTKAEEFNKSIATVDFKSANQTIEKEMAQRLFAISVAEAQGVTSHEDAEMAKLDYTIKSYDKMIEVAKKYAEAAKVGGTEEQQTEAQTKVDAAIEKSNEVRLQKLQAYGTKRIAIEEKIKEQVAKQTEEQSKHDDKVLENKKTAADKLDALEKATGLKAKGVAQDVLNFRKAQAKEIVDLEESVKTKIVEIAEEAKSKRLEADKDYEEKRKELVKARVEIERSAAADIAGLQDSLQDKITNLRMKGLEGANKERALEKAANDRLLQGKKALAEASARNDKEAIDRAKELMESAGGYYDQLEDPKKAINGLSAVTQALIAARKAQEKAELAENQAKLDKEKTQYLDKIKTINQAEDDALKKAKDRFQLKLDAVNLHYENAVAKEQARHEKEMADIDAEIAKLREKAAVIAGQQAAVVNSAAVPSGGSSGSSAPNITSPDFDMEKYERDVGIATSKGIQKGITAGTQMSAEQVKQAVSEQIAAGTRDGMFEGVKVNGVPLEEWKAQGKKQGTAMAEATTAAVEEGIKSFDITENLEGAPVSVTINPATKEEVDPLLNSIKEALERYPGEPTLDFTEAEKMIQRFVKEAKSKYRIEIPVSVKETQGKSAGGQTYAMAGGGRIPGTKSPKDKVTVKSRPGEWWIPDEQSSYWARSVGSWFMNAVHKPMSQAGQYLKDSVLKGPKSRAVPIPVPSQSGINTNVLSSLKNLGNLDTRIGAKMAEIVDTLSVTSAGAAPTFSVVLNYSGSGSPMDADRMAERVLKSLEKKYRGRS